MQGKQVYQANCLACHGADLKGTPPWPALVYSVTAYILYMNGILDEDATLDAKNLPQVKMPNRDGFYVDDRPDAKNARCMSDCLKKPAS
ncbi:c-type cytochrome [Pusillimonas noertemannii]|uniref:c-type cytochrome n=1 Tax=Pusillimonas noertemannii TaxID=305977 RepID=UPI000E30930D|nr:c-type cytochrome [Pusillimonas noertemannii]NYT69120.1 cytochrome c [Pusillimonas noertemannii]TFL09534.1 cytochrome c [Pusillimonas noertemannii]